MYKVIYKSGAERDLESLDAAVAIRIIRKIAFYAKQTNPLRFAKRITRPTLGMYRFRVGDYRIIFDVTKKGVVQILLILKIGHRKEIYD